MTRMEIIEQLEAARTSLNNELMAIMDELDKSYDAGTKPSPDVEQTNRKLSVASAGLMTALQALRALDKAGL